MTYVLVLVAMLWPALMPVSGRQEPQIVIMQEQPAAPEFSYDQPIDPTRYLIRPGELLTVTFLGTNIDPLGLVVGADGRLVSANIGIFDLAGTTLAKARELLAGPITKQYSASAIDISVGPPRNISILVTGAVANPGYYQGLSSQRVSEIIAQAGGIRPTGSRRYISFRAPEAVYPVDLDKSRFLGQLSFDPPLYIGQQIYVPETFDERVQILGEVQTAREVELFDGDQLEDLLNMAGGVLPTGNAQSAFIVRGSDRLQASAGILRAGDIIVVPPRITLHDTSVLVIGEVARPGRYSYDEGLSLDQLILSAGGVTEQANADRTAIFRLSEKVSWSRARTVRYAVERPVGEADQFDLILQPGDSIIVPHRLGYIRVSGAVRNPGYFAFREKQSVQQYIVTAGGFTTTADRQNTSLIDALSGTSTVVSMDNLVFDGDEVNVPELKVVP